MIKLGFLGAAREVTGSCYLVDTGTHRFVVDCGMFQGLAAEEKNRRPFGFDPAALDFVLLTHAHIDHCGLLPRLAGLGFGGPIYATTPTCDLLEVMLLDSAHIQEKESQWEHGRGGSRGGAKGDGPLYTVDQARASLRQLKPVAYDAEIAPAPKVRARFRDAGHILGSAIIEVSVEADGNWRRVVFSGDIGQYDHPLVRNPSRVEHADVLLVESTYGNRLHKPMAQTLEELVGAVVQTLKVKGGNVIIPAFAVGRTQDVLYLLTRLYREGKLPDMDIYVDSPMATQATAITMKHWASLDPDVPELFDWVRHNRGRPRISFVEKTEESIGLSRIRSGAIILSASGMCDAGRIKYHLRQNLDRPECAVIFTGFQAAGTLGRRIVDGADAVRIFGDEIPVRAAVYTIGGLSAHADQAGLLQWLHGFQAPPDISYIVHGEEAIAQAFGDAVRKQLGWRVQVPEPRSSTTL